LVRPGTVRRSPLIERLARSALGPIVSVVAPAGYGKTTLLAQWAERNGQALAWVSVDEGDDDSKVLLTYVAEPLNAVEPISGLVRLALSGWAGADGGPRASEWASRRRSSTHRPARARHSSTMASVTSAMTAAVAW
jgi:LuxR family transcriptional regulator, maltose regulon positive regulatory protein